MPGVLHRVHPSPLGIVFVVAVAVLLAAGAFAVTGASALLGLERDGAAGALPFTGRLF